MRSLLPLLLLAGCASWPAGSYVQTSNDADTAVLAPAIAECVGYMVPNHAAVSLIAAPNGQAMAAVLVDELTRQAVNVQPTGRVVSYVVAPVDQGTFVSVASPPHARCGQYFSRASGALKADGSMMVTQ